MKSVKSCAECGPTTVGGASGVCSPGMHGDIAVPAILPAAAPRRRHPSLVRQGATVFGGSTVLGACGFLFQMIASRRLGVDAYGTFYTLISVVAIAGLPGALFSPVAVRYVAEFRALRDDRHVRGLAADLVRWASVAALAYVLLASALALPVASYLHVPVWALPVTGIIAAVGLGSAALRAIAQGTQEFTGFALSASAEGVAKVAGLAAFVLIGFGLLGGLLGFLTGGLCGLGAIAWWLARRYASVGPQRVRYDWRRIALSTAGSASMTLAMTLIGTVDVILVKHYFTAHEAGLYAAAALGGKALLFFVGFVPMVLLPRVTDHHARGERTRRVLFLSVSVLAGVALFGGIALKLFGAFFLHLLVGHTYDAALPLLLLYSFAMLALGLTNILALYGIATHRLAFGIPLVAGALATLLSIALLHPSLESVVLTLVVGNVLTCAAVAAALGMQASRREPLVREPEITIVGPLPWADRVVQLSRRLLRRLGKCVE